MQIHLPKHACPVPFFGRADKIAGEGFFCCIPAEYAAEVLKQIIRLVSTEAIFKHFSTYQIGFIDPEHGSRRVNFAPLYRETVSLFLKKLLRVVMVPAFYFPVAASYLGAYLFTSIAIYIPYKRPFGTLTYWATKTGIWASVGL